MTTSGLGDHDGAAGAAAGGPRSRTLVMRREIAVPLERLWDAWTTARGLAGWWWNHWDA